MRGIEFVLATSLVLESLACKEYVDPDIIPGKRGVDLFKWFAGEPSDSFAPEVHLRKFVLESPRGGLIYIDCARAQVMLDQYYKGDPIPNSVQKKYQELCNDED